MKKILTQPKVVFNSKEFIIPFVGLKLGKHTFDFHVTDAFFSQFEYAEIKKGQVDVHLTLGKQENMLILNFEIEGKVNVLCDTCAENFDLAVQGEQKLIVKFGEAHYEDTDEIITLSETAYELDVNHSIYEYIHLLLPIKRTHPKGKCNMEVVKKIKELSQKKSSVNEAHWNTLTKIKYN